MGKHHLSILLCIAIFILSCYQGDSRRRTTRNISKVKIGKLFVFGDSYGDTGNNPVSIGMSWKTPYGINYPGKPTGRYSNGRVMTDYIATFVGLQTPIAYKQRSVGKKQVDYGMNFADGGTGVFDTRFGGLNMTAQINLFHQLYSQTELGSSVALVALSGNDYANGSPEGMPKYINSVVNQLAVNLERIQKMGIRKIAVNALPPLGCLPSNTAKTLFTRCDENINMLVKYHNDLLQKAVTKLNNNQKNIPSFFILDLYQAFKTVLSNTGTKKFENPLKQCCLGVCGMIGENGVKNYTVCDRPDSSFFWDFAHPTQAGWQAVYSVLQHDLQQFY